MATTFMIMAFMAFMAMFTLLLGNVYTSAAGTVVQATLALARILTLAPSPPNPGHCRRLLCWPES